MITLQNAFRYGQLEAVDNIYRVLCKRGPWGEILDPETAYFNIVRPFISSSNASKPLFLKLWYAYHY